MVYNVQFLTQNTVDQYKIERHTDSHKDNI